MASLKQKNRLPSKMFLFFLQITHNMFCYQPFEGLCFLNPYPENPVHPVKNSFSNGLVNKGNWS